ncbi:unnamed protein product [Lathyrus sativus]|nr:unnamed protein product [Lathyrus sativus]
MMIEVATPANTTSSDSTPANTTSSDSTPADTTSSDSTRLKEVRESLGQYFGLLFAIIGVASRYTTNNEKSLLIMVLAFMVTLYFMVLVIVKALQLHVPFMILVNLFLFLGALISLLGLMIISRIIGWIYLTLWIFLVVGLVCYKNGKEIYQMISTRIQKLFPKGNVEISDHHLESSGVKRLPI